MPYMRLDAFLKNTLQQIFWLYDTRSNNFTVSPGINVCELVTVQSHILQNWFKETKFLPKWNFWNFKRLFDNKYFTSAGWYATNQWNVLSIEKNGGV